MRSKAREYLARAAQCEEHAKKTRHPKDREWDLIVARAYRNLAEMESEVAARPVAAA
jgi:hypothetical protein